jgi:CheY-like chemotaxis protein
MHPENPPLPTQQLSSPGVPHGAPLTRPVLPLHGVTLLVVEDSRFASEALRLMCQHSGARMRRAECMAQARQHLTVWRPDVVIVDLGLPDGEGTDLIRDLAAPPGFGPAILASSGDPDLRAGALDAGASGFLEKPVNSLSAFQAAILRLFPGAPQPKDDLQEVPPPDRMALTDDLLHAADLLAQPTGQAARGYLTRFLSGLARAAGDGALAHAAQRAAAAEEDLPALSALIQARLAMAPPPFGPG